MGMVYVVGFANSDSWCNLIMKVFSTNSSKIAIKILMTMMMILMTIATQYSVWVKRM